MEQAYVEKSFRQTGYKEVPPYSRIRCHKSWSLPAFSCPLAKTASPHSVRRINLRSSFFQVAVPLDRSVLSITNPKESPMIDSRTTEIFESIDYLLFYRPIYIPESIFNQLNKPKLHVCIRFLSK